MLHQAKEMQIPLGDIILIKDDEKHRGEWDIGLVEKLCKGQRWRDTGSGIENIKIVY